MQRALPGTAETQAATNRLPTLTVRKVNDNTLVVRYRNIGHQQRFQLMLQRLRLEFPLATCQHLDGQPWWTIAASQHDQVQEFCRRNGLQLIEEV